MLGTTFAGSDIDLNAAFCGVLWGLSVLFAVAEIMMGTQTHFLLDWKLVTFRLSRLFIWDRGKSWWIDCLHQQIK